MKPSIYQEAFYEFILNGQGNVIIEATAGSGKTHSMIHAANLVSDKRCVFLAFNSSIASELQKKIPKNCEASTLNSIGYRAWAKHAGRCQVDANKTNQILAEIMDEDDYRFLSSHCKRLVSLAKANGLVPEGINGVKVITEDTDEFWYDLVDFYSMDIHGFLQENKQGELVPSQTANKILHYCREALKKSIKRQNLIDFDDQLYMTTIHQLPLGTYDFVFVDEVQDTNLIQQEMLKLAITMNTRLVAVGDRKQCQPPGTMVLTKDKKFVPIETLKDGDEVVTWNRHKQILLGYAPPYSKIKVAKRHYSGNMFEIIAGDKSTKSTADHIWTVKFSRTTSLWVSYLMESPKGLFRLGWCQLFNKLNSNHFTHRTRLEKSKRSWILGVHYSKSEASFNEAILADQFNIPLLMFQESTTGTGLLYNQEFLDKFWDSIDYEKNRRSGLAILKHFKREYRYPFYDADDYQQRRGRTTVFEVRSCNLLSEIMQVPVPLEKRKPNWTTISVKTSEYDGDVYSLDVGKNEHYIADGIVTHNCIYSFRSALNNSMQRLQDSFKCKVLPLSICYRCPTSHLDLAREIVPHIENSPTAIKGEVHHFGENWNHEIFKSNDLIICRTNAPLVKTAYKLLAAKLPVKILGRDIGSGIVTLIKKLKPKDQDDLSIKIENWKEKEIKKILKKDPKGNTDLVEDKYETVLAFQEMFSDRTIEGLIAGISEIYSDQGANITLASVHRAKGLEGERVFVINIEDMPSKMAKKDWEIEQEMNIKYIALTRAKEYMGFITVKKKKFQR